MPPHKPLGGGELHATKMLFVVAIALAQPSWISVHAADGRMPDPLCHSTQLSEGKPAMDFPSWFRSLGTTGTEVS